MPHESTAPAGTRFFARLDRFHCECPSCACLIVAAKDPNQTPARLRRMGARLTTYNPLTSTLYCPRCRRSFGVGLLLWPIQRGGRKHQIPADHQPTRRQLRDLAQYAYGIWADEVKKQGDALNVAVDQACTCPQEEGGWAPRCPVHGWERHLERQRALWGDEGGGGAGGEGEESG